MWIVLAGWQKPEAHLTQCGGQQFQYRGLYVCEG